MSCQILNKLVTYIMIGKDISYTSGSVLRTVKISKNERKDGKRKVDRPTEKYGRNCQIIKHK